MARLRLMILLFISCSMIIGCRRSTHHTLVEPTSLPPAPPVTRQAWIHTPASLHTAPEATSRVIRQLMPGTPLTITATEHEWYFTTIQDRLGGWGWVTKAETSTVPMLTGPEVGDARPFDEKKFIREYYKQYRERQAWQKVVKADTVEAYLTYVDAYLFSDSGLCLPEAIQRLEELTWAFVRRTNTFENYVKYLEFFSAGSHADEARLKLRKLASSRRRRLSDFWESFQTSRHLDLAVMRDQLLTVRQNRSPQDCHLTVH